jgi:HD-GYP domain-containing protein (c-di-GMP phosphodiesterase class II)
MITTDGPSVSEASVLLSGGAGKQVNSARAGFLPIAIERVPVGALHEIPVYVRASGTGKAFVKEDLVQGQFALYCADNVRFTEVHRRRLMDHGVRFLYIKMADQSRFREQVEAKLEEIANDPVVAIAEKSALIYETSVELVNEMLAEPEGVLRSPRMQKVAKAITTLVMDNDRAFTHLFAASHHDFYTATHMVNVATWMVPLAYALGHRDQDELNHICQAGLMHDMGKIRVPESVLNKTGKLSDEDWAQIKGHPNAGVEYLSQFEGIHPLVLTVTAQHHERLDGTGYPKGLKGDEIDRISRICAVVDSFDAMTAFRPFKERTLGVDEALTILKKETPAKYDSEVLEAWIGLLQTVEASPLADDSPPPTGLAALAVPAIPSNKRAHERQKLHCHGRAHLLVRAPAGIEERPGLPIVAHSISRGGMGFLTQGRVQLGEYARVYLQAKGWEKRALEGQVVRCRIYDDRWNEIGLTFGPAELESVPWKSAAHG